MGQCLGLSQGRNTVHGVSSKTRWWGKGGTNQGEGRWVAAGGVRDRDARGTAGGSVGSAGDARGAVCAMGAAAMGSADASTAGAVLVGGGADARGVAGSACARGVAGAGAVDGRGSAAREKGSAARERGPAGSTPPGCLGEGKGASVHREMTPSECQHDTGRVGLGGTARQGRAGKHSGHRPRAELWSPEWTQDQGWLSRGPNRDGHTTGLPGESSAGHSGNTGGARLTSGSLCWSSLRASSREGGSWMSRGG